MLTPDPLARRARACAWGWAAPRRLLLEARHAWGATAVAAARSGKRSWTGDFIVPRRLGKASGDQARMAEEDTCKSQVVVLEARPESLGDSELAARRT